MKQIFHAFDGLGQRAIVLIQDFAKKSRKIRASTVDAAAALEGVPSRCCNARSWPGDNVLPVLHVCLTEFPENFDRLS